MNINKNWVLPLVATLAISSIPFLKSAKAETPIAHQSKSAVIEMDVGPNLDLGITNGELYVYTSSVGGDPTLIINKGDPLGQTIANIHEHGMVLANVNGPYYTFISP